MFTSLKLFSALRTPEKKPILLPPEFPSLLDLANTPRSYELFDTYQEELLARAQFTLGALNETLVEEKPENYSYFLFGCHGSVKEAQRSVAKAMKTFLETEGFSPEKKPSEELKINFPLPKRTLPSNKQTKPSFAIVAGDNLYTDGAYSPNDKAFKNGFYDIYGQSRNDLIKLHVLGNHDCNIHKLAIGARGLSIAVNEIAHTFLNSEGAFDTKRLKYLEQRFISLEFLTKNNYHWFLPSRFYEVTYKGTTFLFMDSNHIALDFLEYHKLLAKLKLEVIELDKETLNSTSFPFDSVERSQANMAIAGLKIEIEKLMIQIENNQAYWLEQAFIRHPDTRKVLIWHHPVFTPSKRSESKHNDMLQYLNQNPLEAKNQLDSLEKLGICTKNYSTILKTILIRLKIPKTKQTLLEKIRDSKSPSLCQSVISGIDVFHCAHEHIQLISNNKLEHETGVFQIIAGGGGGDAELDPIRKYNKIRDILFHESYGFSVVTLNSKPQNEIYAEIFSLKGPYACFSNKSLDPVFDLSDIKPIKDQKVYKPIRALLLQACHEYIDSFVLSPSSYKTDVNLTLSLINTLNNPRPTSLTALFDKVESLPSKCGLMPYIHSKMQHIIQHMIFESVPLPTFVCSFYQPDSAQKELFLKEKSSTLPLVDLNISTREFSKNDEDMSYLRCGS